MKKIDWKEILNEHKNHQILCFWGPTTWKREDLYFLEQAVSKVYSKNDRKPVKVMTVPSRADYIRRYAYQGLFFQQRFQSMYNDHGITVWQMLKEAGKAFHPTTIEEYADYFDLKDMYGKPLIQLSTGEWKRYSLCLTLLRQPDALISPQGLDGLDVFWQERIPQLWSETFASVHPFITTADQPIAHPAVKNISVARLPGFKETLSSAKEPSEALIKKFRDYKNSLPSYSENNPVIEMKDVNIRYGNNRILVDVNWKVNPGEKWNVRGPNGAGKSTLLSLVNADNPQGYSQDIRLFNLPYGQTTIWDRKARIAFFSSDYFQYFRSSKKVKEVIRQHLHTPYLDTPQPPEDLIQLLAQYFDLEEHWETSYARLNAVLRRQALLLAIYLKSSELLLLDEPYHEFDESRISKNNLFLEVTQEDIPQTVVFVTHRADHMPRFINKVLEIQNGHAFDRS